MGVAHGDSIVLCLSMGYEVTQNGPGNTVLAMAMNLSSGPKIF